MKRKSEDDMEMAAVETEPVRVVTRLRSGEGSPYGQSRSFQSAKTPHETHDAYERRCWRERAHQNAGHMVIPAAGFQHAIQAAAGYLQMKIPGQGNCQYKAHFERGLMAFGEIELPELVAELPEKWLFLPSDGRPGSGKRVWKSFPHVASWEGQITWMILDPVITLDVFRLMLTTAGKFIGVGFFRPERRGWWGRFSVEEIT